HRLSAVRATAGNGRRPANHAPLSRRRRGCNSRRDCPTTAVTFSPEAESMSGVWTCPRNHRWRPSATDSTTLDAVQPGTVCGEPGTLIAADSVEIPTADPTLTRDDAPRPVPAQEVCIPGYAVTAEIGRGAMGVVYRATETALNRPVALKMILAGAH